MCVYFYLIHILVSWYDSQIRHQTWRRHRRRPKEVGSGGPWAEDRWDLSWEYQRFGGWSWMKIKNLRFTVYFLNLRFMELRTELRTCQKIGSFCLIKMNREKLTISNPFWVWVGDGPGGSTMEMLQAVELNSIPPSHSIHLNVSRYECEGGMEFKWIKRDI